MKTKTEIIETIDPTKTYLGSYVIARIKEVDCDDTFTPLSLRKGDVLSLSAGLKQRPCVVINVKKDYCICIPLTSTENVHNLCESDSRFFGNGNFSNTYEVVSIDIAKKRFIGVYDNMKLLNNAIKELRLFIVKNI